MTRIVTARPPKRRKGLTPVIQLNEPKAPPMPEDPGFESSNLYLDLRVDARDIFLQGVRIVLRAEVPTECHSVRISARPPSLLVPMALAYRRKAVQRS